MASFSCHAIPILLAMAVILTVTPLRLSSSTKQLEISTISAAPVTLPDVPESVPAYLSPDIAPLLPSPGGMGPSPSSGSDGELPTIPSNPSPPNPDDVGAAAGPNSAVSPSGSFNAMASTASAASAPTKCSWTWCSFAAYVGLCCSFCFWQLIAINYN